LSPFFGQRPMLPIFGDVIIVHDRSSGIEQCSTLSLVDLYALNEFEFLHDRVAAELKTCAER
jgi:hypothetical protein